MRFWSGVTFVQNTFCLLRTGYRSRGGGASLSLLPQAHQSRVLPSPVAFVWLLLPSGSGPSAALRYRVFHSFFVYSSSRAYVTRRPIHCFLLHCRSLILQSITAVRHPKPAIHVHTHQHATLTPHEALQSPPRFERRPRALRTYSTALTTLTMTGPTLSPHSSLCFLCAPEHSGKVSLFQQRQSTTPLSPSLLLWRIDFLSFSLIEPSLYTSAMRIGATARVVTAAAGRRPLTAKRWLGFARVRHEGVGRKAMLLSVVMKGSRKRGSSLWCR